MDAEKHCNTKVPLTIEDIRSLWNNVDDKVRLEIVKSVIWTSPDNHGFYAKVIKILNSEGFLETLD